MSLWIESAHQSLTKSGAEACGDAVRTLQTEEQFFAVLVSGPQDDEACPEPCPEQGRREGRRAGRVKAISVADQAASLLEQGTPLERVVETLLDALPHGEHVPFSILQVLEGYRAHLVECDAPPLFLTRADRLVLLPVMEEESQGHLVRECDFTLQDGDHVAMVSEGYVRAGGQQGRRWRWQDVAISIRRWTETGCDAQQLLGALIRTYHRLAGGEPRQDVTVIAMHVRPMRSATVWTGPPADPVLDPMALEKLMAEPGMRIICGDTTAEIAARLLGAELELEPRPEDGWAEVPPTSRLEGVNLVTEGLVTLGKARERMANDEWRITSRNSQFAIRHLKEDGATRLARMLLMADKIHFIVGLAVNPGQAADAAATIPLRRIVIDDLVRALKAHGKIVSVEYF